MAVQRIDQGMAVAAVNALPERVDGDLRTRYRQLRIMLHSAGLAASFAFIASKAGDPDQGGTAGAYGKVAEALVKRLVVKGSLTGDPDSLSTTDVMRQLGGMSPVDYARASAEAAALVSWLSRLANAVAAEGGDGAA
ncbi:MAG TPA: type III-B CRISPR module-associated protein Cmr5 [Trebonia sp.]